MCMQAGRGFDAAMFSIVFFKATCLKALGTRFHRCHLRVGFTANLAFSRRSFQGVVFWMFLKPGFQATKMLHWNAHPRKASNSFGEIALIKLP